MPSIRIQGLTTLDAGPYPGAWSGYVYGYTNTTTKVLNTHTIKWGAYFEHSGQNDFIQGTTASSGTTVNQNGDFTFNDTGNPSTAGLAIANAALGNFDLYSEFGAKAYTPYVANALDLFVQDSWKVTPKLTLEYGVRWSIWPQWKSKWGNLSEFLPEFYNRAAAPVVDPKGGYIISGDQYNGIVLPGNGVPDAEGGRVPALHSGQFTRLYHGLPDGLSPTHWDVFQPRLGVAYGFSPKMSLRAGVGSFANRTMINRDTSLGGNAPFQIQESVVNGLVDQPGGATQRVFPFTQTIQDPVFKVPTAWEWNATFQREVFSGTTVEVGYVGRRGLHNQIKRNINQLLTGYVAGEPGNQHQLPSALSRIWRHRHLRERRQFPIQRLASQCSASLFVRFAIRPGIHVLAFNRQRFEPDRCAAQRLRCSCVLRAFRFRSHSCRSGQLHVRPAVLQKRERICAKRTGRLGDLGYQSISIGYSSFRSHQRRYCGYWTGKWEPVLQPGWRPLDGADSIHKLSTWFNAAAFAKPAAGTYGVQPRNGLEVQGFAPGTWACGRTSGSMKPIASVPFRDVRHPESSELEQSDC